MNKKDIRRNNKINPRIENTGWTISLSIKSNQGTWIFNK